MPNRSDQLTELALSWLQTNVLRLIATKVLPLLATFGALNAVLAWAQAEIGLDLPSEVVVGWIGTVMAGAVAAAFAYVRNHGGAAALGKVLLELEDLRSAGTSQGRQLGLGDEDGYTLVELGVFLLCFVIACAVAVAVFA